MATQGKEFTPGAEGEPKSKGLRTIELLNKYSTLFMTIAAAVLGIGITLWIIQASDIGIMYRRAEFNYVIGMPGMIFLRVLLLIVVPLIMTTIANAIGSMDMHTSQVLGMWTTIYYAVTMIIAVTVAVIFAATLLPQPEQAIVSSRYSNPDKDNFIDWGVPQVFNSVPLFVQTFADEAIGGKVETNPNYYALLDMIRNLFPNNLIGAFLYDEAICPVTKPGDKPVDFEKDINRQIVQRKSPNVLGLLVITIVIGFLLAKISHSHEGKHILLLLAGAERILVMAVRGIIRLTPFCVLSLIMDNLLRNMDKLGLLGMSVLQYCGVVTLALAVQLFLVLPLIYFVLTRKNPMVFFRGVLPAWINALATASSNATVPITIYCLHANNGVDKRVASFVASIGATINMNGTACYEGITALFLAKMSGMHLQFGDYLIGAIAATLAAVATSGIPSGGLVSLLMVLSSLGVNPNMMALIVPVDFILNRFRASVNVMGNAFGAGILYERMKDTLDATDQKQKEEDDRIATLEAEEEIARLVAVLSRDPRFAKFFSELEANEQAEQRR